VAGTIHLVPHTHYDVVWAFNKEDYFLIFTSILNKALKMIEEEGFRFLLEQTYPLEMLERRSPRLFAKVETAIREGKIEIVDGQYLMPDTMIPGGEVLVREILHGKRYCREKFGVDVPVAWAADGFGLNAQLPQLYKKSGYEWVAFRRGLPSSIGSSVSEFLWEGLDGTRIVSHWMPLGYRAGLDLDEWGLSYAHLLDLATSSHVLMPCGSGGAIPQEDIPQRVKEWNKKYKKLNMIMTTPRTFFEGLESDKPDLVTFRGQMYSDELESIFVDVSSSRIRLRLAIRDCELDLLVAEKAASLAFLQGKPYPAEAMDEIWKKKLFLIMHDVVPGCGIDEIYEEAWEYIEDIQDETPKILTSSVKHLVAGEEPLRQIIVFNPNSWHVKDYVETNFELAEGWSSAPGIAGDEGEIPSQEVEVTRWDDGSIRHATVGFVAEVPPLGCKAYSIARKCDAPPPEKSDAVNTTIKGEFYDVTVDEKTGIVSVMDHDGNELMNGNEIIIDEELGDLYFHRSILDKHIGSEGGDGLHFGIFKPEGFDVEEGPVRTVVAFRNDYYCLRWPYYLIDKYEPLLYRHKTLEVTKQVFIYHDLPRVDFATKINLFQPHVRVRLRLNTCMVAPAYTRQTQFGALELPEAQSLQESFNTPSLSWIAAEEEDRGLAILTLGMPINEIKGGEIYCTLLRSVSVLSNDGISGPLIPTPKAQELGEHHYRYSVRPYTGSWKDAGIHLRGFETAQPLTAMQSARKSPQTELGSFTLEPQNLILSALKKAEDDDALIFRFFETCGWPCTARIGLPPTVRRAWIVNLLEDTESEVEIIDSAIELEVGAFEIMSLKLAHWR
jgi:alpha-mannosidase